MGVRAYDKICMHGWRLLEKNVQKKKDIKKVLIMKKMLLESKKIIKKRYWAVDVYFWYIFLMTRAGSDVCLF